MVYQFLHECLLLYVHPVVVLRALRNSASMILNPEFRTQNSRGSTLIDSARIVRGAHTRTHTRLTALCPGPPGWAGTRKAKPIWILLKQETVSGSGISWAICKSAARSRQITTPSRHHSVFYRPHALPATQPTVSKHWRHSMRSRVYETFGRLPVSVCLSHHSSTKRCCVWARGRCRISPPRFLAECCKRQLNQGSFVSLYFRLFTFFWFVLSLFICVFLYCFVCQYQSSD